MVNFDSYVPPAELPGPSWEMKTKLYMTPFDCISVEPEGFTGSVMLASPFGSGTCTTQVFRGQQRILQEHGPLYPSPTDPLAAFLPAESPLAKCRGYFNCRWNNSTLCRSCSVQGGRLPNAVSPTSRMQTAPRQQSSRLHHQVCEPVPTTDFHSISHYSTILHDVSTHNSTSHIITLVKHYSFNIISTGYCSGDKLSILAPATTSQHNTNQFSVFLWFSCPATSLPTAIFFDWL
ncbi:hypothetical protein BDN71DRAFT_949248 [Pleurotus eryngii]|uniref:Uncharacterized protein n=1 Tax=Pleurotus eryngii TaxID=5323 RepID=A0A9P6DBV8_PLEER|nr:hypothetical protein BDN71DRAFT_949248 [Pleurotus eryngii]